MSDSGAITFADLIGHLVVLRVECERCRRRGQYHVDRLIREHGRDKGIPDWLGGIRSTCARSGSFSDPCRANCPDLVEVLGAGKA